MHKPRVLIFSLAYFPLVGGAEIAVKEIADRLGGSFDFDLVTLRFNKKQALKEKLGNINVFRVGGGKLFFPFKSVFLARKLNKENPYKIIWSIMAAYAGFGALFFKILNPKVNFLLTLQEGDSEKHILKRVGILYPLWKQIFKKADYIQVISNYLADFARRYGAKCPVEVVPNGVDLKKFQIPDSKLQISSKPQVPSSKIIITTSRLVYKNGVDILIRAVAKLQATSYKLQVFIVGDGPDRLKLEQLIKDLNVADHISLVGHVSPEEIPSYLYKADLFVRASRSEGLGNSFLEAMAAGLPVIGTNIGGIADFLKDKETGFIVKPDDAEGLAKTIEMVLNNAEQSKNIAENGRRLVFEKYSWDTIANNIKKILYEI